MARRRVSRSRPRKAPARKPAGKKSSAKGGARKAPSAKRPRGKQGMMPKGKPKKAGPQALANKLPAPNKQYYVNVGGQTQGPFTQVVLAQKVQSGALNGAHIAADGEQGWVTAMTHPDYRLIHEAAMTPDYDEWVPAPRLKSHFPVLLVMGLGALALTCLSGLFTVASYGGMSRAQRDVDRAASGSSGGYYSSLEYAEDRLSSARFRVFGGGAAACVLPFLALPMIGVDRWLAKKVKTHNAQAQAEMAAGEALLQPMEVGSPMMSEPGPEDAAPGYGQPQPPPG